MRWNKKKIISTLTSLCEKINNSKDESTIVMLKRDYSTALAVLKLIDYEKYIYYSKLINLENFDYNKYYRNSEITSANAIIDNKDDILDLAILLDEYNFTNISLLLLKKMPKDLYLEAVRIFFKNFSKDCYNLYLELLDGGYVQFANNRQKPDAAKGSCYHIYTEKESYIVTDFKRKDFVETLPHEIAHAYEFSLLDDYNRTINWHVSTFREAYPRFMELAFLDFYIENFKDDKYINLFIETKRTLFESMKAECEYYLNQIALFTTFNQNLGQFICQNNKHVSKYPIDLIISDFVGVYMFHLYKKDKEELKVFLERYNFIKGYNDYLIWEMLDLKKIMMAFRSEASDLKKEFVLNRQRKKHGTFQQK